MTDQPPKLTLLERVACWVGIWALRRLYDADCETDVADEFPDDPDMGRCFSCDAKRLVISMEEILQDD